MAYEATAELYKRQYDLAKKRAQSEYDSRIGELATQYRQANRDLEGNLESRGILRSGEGMRGRVRLGAAEKGAQLSAEAARQAAMDEAGLSYMQQLAELQAKGYTGGEATTPTPTTPTPSPVVSPPPTEVTRPVVPTPTTPTGPTAPPSGPSNTACPPGYVYDPVKKTCVRQADLPTVGGRPVPPGQTPSETIGVPPTITTPVGPQPLKPGQPYPGPDRKLPNGGAVVDGIYIPPGISFGPPPKGGGASGGKAR